MMASLLLSRVLGMLRDTVMLSQFQVGLQTDAYRLAFTIPDLLFMLIAGGGLSSAFIPVFSEYFHTDREEDAWNVFSVVTTVCSVVVTGLIAITWIIAPVVVNFVSAGKTFHQNGVEVPVTAAYLDQVVAMSRIMLPAQFAFLIGSILIGTLYSRHRFVAPGLAPNVYNIGLIAGAFLGPIIGIGIFGMCWGALIGATVGNLLIPFLVMAKLGSRYKFSFDLKTPGVSKFFKLLLPVILGFSLPSVCNLITTKFTSFYDEGITTVMTTANNLMQAPLGIFGHALALAAFPVLSHFVAQNRMDLYRNQVTRTMRTTIYLAFPAAAIMLAAAPQIVHVLYEYGKQASRHTANEEIAVSLQVFSLGVVAWCMQPILMRAFFSLHKTLKPIMMSTGITVLFIVLCWANSYSGLGYKGLPLATDIAAILLSIVLYFALERETGPDEEPIGKLDRKGVVKTLVKSGLASVVMGAFIFGVFHFLSLTSLRRPIAVLAFAAIILCAAWIYIYITTKFNMPETDYVQKAMTRINRKKRPIAEAEASID